MVRTKASVQKVDASLLRQSLWTVCRLSREPLQAPVVSDALGRLYNKDAVIQHLLQRHQSEPTTDPIPHIRGLRDTTDLNLTTNTLYRPASAGQSEQHSVYRSCARSRRVRWMACIASSTSPVRLCHVCIGPAGYPDRCARRSAPLPSVRKALPRRLTKGAKAVQGSDVATINPTRTRRTGCERRWNQEHSTRRRRRAQPIRKMARIQSKRPRNVARRRRRTKHESGLRSSPPNSPRKGVTHRHARTHPHLPHRRCSCHHARC